MFWSKFLFTSTLLCYCKVSWCAPKLWDLEWVPPTPTFYATTLSWRSYDAANDGEEVTKPSNCITHSQFTWSKQKWLFGESVFIQPIRVFKKPWLAGKKPALQKRHFWFDHANRLIERERGERSTKKRHTSMIILEKLLSYFRVVAIISAIILIERWL